MNLFRGWFANIVFRGLVCSVKLISGKTVVNSELLYRPQLEKVIPSVHERKHGDIYASIHLWAWRPALFVARPDHDKMWQYDVEPCCCISLQIKLVKTWISYFLLLHAEPFKLCYAKRSEVICRQPKWEPWLHRLWMLVVCSGLLIYKGVYSVRKLLR